jgi:hypothetical protein
MEYGNDIRFSNRGVHCAVWIEFLNACTSQFESSLLRVNHFCFATDEGYRYSASDSTWHWCAFCTLWTSAVDVRRFTLRPFCSLRKSHWFPLRIMNVRPRSYLAVDSKTKLTLCRESNVSRSAGHVADWAVSTLTLSRTLVTDIIVSKWWKRGHKRWVTRATLFTHHFPNRAIQTVQNCHESIYNGSEWSEKWSCFFIGDAVRCLSVCLSVDINRT